MTTMGIESKRLERSRLGQLPKAQTGISGLDEVTGGGLPRGRPTLICGPAGCGKTLLAMEFLVRGITEADGRLMLDHVNVARAQIEDAGEWDLEGLFLRLGASIDAVGAKRVVIDTIETLFGAFSNAAVLRAELRRLLVWLKER